MEGLKRLQSKASWMEEGRLQLQRDASSRGNNSIGAKRASRCVALDYKIDRLAQEAFASLVCAITTLALPCALFALASSDHLDLDDEEAFASISSISTALIMSSFIAQIQAGSHLVELSHRLSKHRKNYSLATPQERSLPSNQTQGYRAQEVAVIHSYLTY